MTAACYAHALEGTLDTDSAANALSTVPRGLHKYVPIVGGDRQFQEAPDGFFTDLADALRRIDNTLPVATPPAGTPVADPGTTPPGD